MNWINCNKQMPQINTKVILYHKNIKEQRIGIYLGKGQFYYADCCQGIKKICTANYWMALPKSPSEIK